MSRWGKRLRQCSIYRKWQLFHVFSKRADSSEADKIETTCSKQNCTFHERAEIPGVESNRKCFTKELGKSVKRNVCKARHKVVICSKTAITSGGERRGQETIAEKESTDNLLSRKHADFIHTILWLTTHLFHTHICPCTYIGMYCIIPFPHTNRSQIVINMLYGYGYVYTAINLLWITECMYRWKD